MLLIVLWVLLAFVVVLVLIVVQIALTFKRGAVGSAVLEARRVELMTAFDGVRDTSWRFSASIDGRPFTFDAFPSSRSSHASTVVEIRLESTEEPTAEDAGYRNAPARPVHRASDARPELTLRRPTWMDRWSKRLKVGRVIRTGDEVFDREVHAECDGSDAVVSATFGAERVRRAARRALELGLTEIAIEGETLRATCEQPTSADLDEKVVKEVVQQLDALGSFIPSTDEEARRKAPLWNRSWALALMLINLALVFVAGISAMHATLLQPMALVPATCLCAIASLVLLFPIAPLLRRRFDAFRFLAKLAVPLMFGVASLSVIVLPTYNCRADSGLIVAHRVPVIRQSTSWTKNGLSYHVVVKGWDGGEDLVLADSASLYPKVSVGTVIAVTTRPGALGWEWIVSTTVVGP